MNVRGKTVLIFGDSHSEGKGSPGYALGEKLAGLGAKSVSFQVKSGRSVWSFFEKEDGGKILAAEIAKKPDVVIFILGTNDGAADTGYEKLYGDLYAPFKKAGVQVLFFGPPYWPREITFAKPGEDPSEKAKAQTDKLNDDMAEVAVLQKKVFGKAWHDSRPMTLDIPASGRAKQADGDVGIHFNAAGADVWAGRMAAAVSGAKHAFVLTRQAGLFLGGGLLVAGAGGLYLAWRRKKKYVEKVGALRG